MFSMQSQIKQAFSVSNGSMQQKMAFSFVLLCLWLWCLEDVFGARDSEMKLFFLMEGDSFTLDNASIMRNESVLQWLFGSENPDTIIAEINIPANISEVRDERFRDRARLDNQTGSLTINNIRYTDTGLYKLDISINPEANKVFNVTVYALLPVPVITRDPSICSSSPELSPLSKCELLCSVVNVSGVMLSWYNGTSLVSSTRASELPVNLSLPLEVEHEDNNSYSCLANNTLGNQSKHLDFNLHCQCQDTSVRTYYIVLATAVGSLVIGAAIVVICVCWKRRETVKEAQTSEDEITYADPIFHKRNSQRMKLKEEEAVVYGILR